MWINLYAMGEYAVICTPGFRYKKLWHKKLQPLASAPRKLLTCPAGQRIFLRARKRLKSCPFDMITIAFCSISRGQAENHGFGAPFGETFFPEVSVPLCVAEK